MLTSSPRRLAAWLLGLGSLGLLATCAFYALAGPLAALPGGATDTAAAIAATPAAAPWMRAAGTIGMISDVLLAVGASLYATVAHAQGRAAALAGWLALALASASFVVVDAMVAYVLPVVAEPASTSYVAVRALFDVLFAAGAWTASGGALAAAWRRDGEIFRRPLVGWALRGAGGLGLAASTAYFAALPGVPLLGPSIALLALATLAVALVVGTSPPSPA
ncbi:MAG: hypothetical protein U0234_08575 [Sandaracinus sp.]